MRPEHLILMYCLFSLFLGACSRDDNHHPPAQNQNKVSQNITTLQQILVQDTTQFKKIYGPMALTFPTDHGPHPEFKTEWWYFTGNLQNRQQQHFGYQLTFFRFSLANPPNPKTKWHSEQVYMAHFAISDITRQQFYHHEKIQRQALAIAGSQSKPFKVWLDQWSVTGNPEQQLSLTAQYKNISLALTLKPEKPKILQGDKGFSKKSQTPGNASMYYSYTRLNTTGSLSIGNQNHRVTGSSWFDREWSSSVLDYNLNGWDWFSIQLNDQSELMYYRLRTKDNKTSPESAGNIIDQQGQMTTLQTNDVQIEVLNYWQSPVTHKKYPSLIKLTLPKHQKSYRIKPQILNQEFLGLIQYWEGSIVILDDNNHPIGYGYMELTGY